MDSSLLQEALQALQDHPEKDRIRKLLHWVCEQDWPRSVNDAVEVSAVLPKLLAKAPTLSALQTELHQGVSNLSKHQKYTEIALTIRQALTPLYVDCRLDVLDGGHADAINWFEVRFTVLKYAVPLQVKVLLQSALDQIFIDRRRDWISLKQVSLDDLLLRLHQTHSTLADLEVHLQRTATQVQFLDQPTQTVQAVLLAMKPLYAETANTFDAIELPDLTYVNPLLSTYTSDDDSQNFLQVPS